MQGFPMRWPKMARREPIARRTSPDSSLWNSTDGSAANPSTSKRARADRLARETHGSLLSVVGRLGPLVRCHVPVRGQTLKQRLSFRLIPRSLLRRSVSSRPGPLCVWSCDLIPVEHCCPMSPQDLGTTRPEKNDACGL